MLIEKIESCKSLKLLSYMNITEEEYKETCKVFKLYPYFAVPSKNITVMCCGSKKNGYYLYSFSTYVDVVKNIVYEDGTTAIRLKYNSKNGEGETERVFPTSILSEEGIKELVKVGIFFDSKHKNDLIKYLLKCQDDVETINSISKIGWQFIDDNLIFNGYERIDKEGYFEESEFNSPFDLKPKGELSKWDEMVQKDVCKNTPLEFVLALGFASPVLALLNETHDLGSIIFNLSNQTSKGKTTAAMLATSVFSNPKSNEGTMITHYGTENAITATLASCNGYTVAIDEVGSSDIKDFSKTLYKISLGVSKRRLGSDSKLKKTEHYSSFVITTAEFDLLTDYSEGGLRSRVFEIEDVLTTGAENSDRIKRTVLRNHALAGDYFVYHFLVNYYPKLESKYRAIKKSIEKRFKVREGITDRVISKFAVILLTIKCCNDCEDFTFKFNYDELFEYSLKQIEKAVKSLDSKKTVIDTVLQEIAMNGGFYPNIKDEYTPSKIRGYTDHKGDYLYYYISTDTFEELMSKNRISDYKKILKNMKENGTLCTESKDKLIKRVSKDNNRLTTYCFKIPKSTDNDTEKELLIKP